MTYVYEEGSCNSKRLGFKEEKKKDGMLAIKIGSLKSASRFNTLDWSIICRNSRRMWGLTALTHDRGWNALSKCKVDSGQLYIIHRWRSFISLQTYFAHILDSSVSIMILPYRLCSSHAPSLKGMRGVALTGQELSQLGSLPQRHKQGFLNASSKKKKSENIVVLTVVM